MADHQELINQFVGIVGATGKQAEFYLELNNWDLNLALSNYYEEPDSSGSIAHNTEIHEEMNDDDSDDDYVPSPEAESSPSNVEKPRGSRGIPRSGVATLRDFGEAEDSDNEDRETLYTGGEKSGMAVQGPKKSQKLVENILKKASSGISSNDDEDKPKKPSYFSGSGYRLGNDTEPSTPATLPTSSSNQPERLEKVSRRLTFWKDGFSIEDGPLLRYDDPANAEALRYINQGRTPLSLFNVQHNQELDVTVVPRLEEEYQAPPKAPPKPFDGSGNRLGSITPVVVSSSSASSSSSPMPSRSLQVDQNHPITTLQIRTADGTRHVVKFNHTHTIADIRGFINASTPGESSRNYVLQTTFPVKVLSDDSQTLADAGILNAVIVQRYT